MEDGSDYFIYYTPFSLPGSPLSGEKIDTIG
jgi:hypothetical protein